MDVRLEAIRRRKRLILLLVFLGIIAALIFLFRAVLAPFLIAIFVAYLIDPVVQRMAGLRLLNRLTLGRGGAIVVIYLFLILCFCVTAIFTVPALGGQLRNARDDLPKVRTVLEERTQRLVDWYTSMVGEDEEKPAEEKPAEEKPAEEAVEDAPETPSRYRVRIRGGAEFTGHVSDQSESRVVVRYGDEFLILDKQDIEAMEPLDKDNAKFDLARLLRQNIQQLSIHLESALVVTIWFAAAVVKALYMIVLVLMITAFIVIDRPRISSFFQSVAPESYRDRWKRLMHSVDRGLAGVIRGQLLIMLVNGLLTWIGLQFLGLRYAVLMGFVAGLFSIIPVFGSILSTIPIVLIAWGTSGLQQGLLALGWILLIHFVEANFLNPKIMGNASKIHPVVVIFALIAGEYAYGIAGALLAVPTASILQSCFKFFVMERQLENPEEPAEPVASTN